MPPFEHLFEPLKLRGHEIRNRILSTGHQTYLAKGGLVSEDLVAYHEARARGGSQAHHCGGGAVSSDGTKRVSRNRRYHRRLHTRLPNAGQGSPSARCETLRSALPFGTALEANVGGASGRRLCSLRRARQSLSYDAARTPGGPHRRADRGLRRRRGALRRGRARRHRACGEPRPAVRAVLEPINQPPAKTRMAAAARTGCAFSVSCLEVVRRTVGDGLVLGIRTPAEEIEPDGLEAEEVTAICLELAQRGAVDVREHDDRLDGRPRRIDTRRAPHGGEDRLCGTEGGLAACRDRSARLRRGTYQPAADRRTGVCRWAGRHVRGWTRALISDPEMPE